MRCVLYNYCITFALRAHARSEIPLPPCHLYGPASWRVPESHRYHHRCHNIRTRTTRRRRGARVCICACICDSPILNTLHTTYVYIHTAARDAREWCANARVRSRAHFVRCIFVRLCDATHAATDRWRLVRSRTYARRLCAYAYVYDYVRGEGRSQNLQNSRIRIGIIVMFGGIGSQSRRDKHTNGHTRQKSTPQIGFYFPQSDFYSLWLNAKSIIALRSCYSSDECTNISLNVFRD